MSQTYSIWAALKRDFHFLALLGADVTSQSFYLNTVNQRKATIANLQSEGALVVPSSVRYTVASQAGPRKAADLVRCSACAGGSP